MKTKEIIEQEFRKDLQELLDMYRAELELVQPMNECHDAQINILILPKYDDQTGNVTEESCDFNI